MPVLAALCFLMAALALYLAIAGVERHFKEFLVHSTEEDVKNAKEAWLIAAAVAIAAGLFLLYANSGFPT